MSNPHAERVRRVAALAGRSTRLRTGQIMVEGPQAARELLAFRRAQVRDVYLTEDAEQRWSEIAEAAYQATRWVHLVSEDVARAMSTNAQGVLAVADLAAIGQQPPDHHADLRGSTSRPALAQPALARLALARIQDPGNVGTMIRCADAMGVAHVELLVGSADPTNPKVIRSSAGSVFHVGVTGGRSLADVVAAAHEDNAMVVGTSGHDGAVDLDQLLSDAQGARGEGAVLKSPHVWVLGNEAQGLTAEEENLCDLLVRIPMAGFAESLNVASAAAMCLWTSQLAVRNS